MRRTISIGTLFLAAVAYLGGCAQARPPNRGMGMNALAPRRIILGGLRVTIPAEFVCKREGDRYTVGNPSNFTDLLSVYQPGHHILPPKEIAKAVSRTTSRIKSNPGKDLRFLRAFDRKVGQRVIHFVECSTETQGLFYYGAMTSLDGHPMHFEMQLSGGIEHPSITGSQIITAIGTFSIAKQESRQ